MKTRPAAGSIAATDLATLGLCETQMVLNSKFGKGQATQRQQQARDRGNQVHESARLAAINSAPLRDRRCFIATAVYGTDAHQTNVLRQWRDTTLLPSWYGPAVVAAYYRISPCVADVLLRTPRLAAAMRRLLGVMVARCERSMQR